MGIGQWWLRRRFRRAISSMEEALKETQEFVDFMDENWERFFDEESDWVISKSEIIRNNDVLIAGLAQIDQIQAKYRK